MLRSSKNSSSSSVQRRSKREAWFLRLAGWWYVHVKPKGSFTNPNLFGRSGRPRAGGRITPHGPSSQRVRTTPPHRRL